MATSLLQLAALSAHPVLSFSTQNFSRGLDATTLATIAGMVFGAAALLTLALARVARIGLHRATGVVSVLIVGTFAWRWLGGGHRPPTSMSGLAHLSAAVVLVLLVRFAFLLARHREFRAAVLVMSLFVASSSGARLAVKHLSIEPTQLPMSAPLDAPPASRARPDLYFVVLDGYGRQDALSMFLGYDNGPFLRELERRGFAVAPRATSAYAMTVASIPAMLAMEYPVGRGAVFDEAQELALYRILHGENPVVRSLERAGYRYVHVESGWVGTRCGRAVDQCVPESVVGNDANGVIGYTPLRALFAPWFDRDTAAGRLDRFDRLEDVAAQRSAAPRFVFSHVLLPHPPLFLDRGCRVHSDAWRRGNVVAANPLEEGRRRAAFLEQVDCTNRRVLRALDRIPRDAAVVIASDHGPDSIGELLEPIESWTSADRVERLSTLAALRLPQGCAVPPDLVSVNLMRVTLNCLLGGDLPLLPERHYAHKERGGVLEVAPFRRTALVPLAGFPAATARRLAAGLLERYGIHVEVLPASRAGRSATASALLSGMARALPARAADERMVLVGLTGRDLPGGEPTAARDRLAVASSARLGTGSTAEARLQKLVARLVGLLQYRLDPLEDGSLLAGEVRTAADLDRRSEEFFPSFVTP